MVICPKCGQQSQNDKVCTNCWSDLTAKPKSEKAPRDLTQMPLRNIILLAAIAIVFGFFMMFIAHIMAQMGK